LIEQLPCGANAQSAIKEFVSLVKLEGSLPSSQEATTGNCYEPNESSAQSENLFMCHPFSYYPSGPFPSGFQIKIVYAFRIPIMSTSFPIHLILLDLIAVIMSTDYGAPPILLHECCFSQNTGCPRKNIGV
jgi:hypothetical protein